jgi:hypothetical protein
VIDDFVWPTGGLLAAQLPDAPISISVACESEAKRRRRSAVVASARTIQCKQARLSAGGLALGAWFQPSPLNFQLDRSGKGG